MYLINKKEKKGDDDDDGGGGGDDKILITQWISQVDVLNHPSVHLFATHCGWGSVSEALSCGVPMILLPLAADQHHNSLFVYNAKMGEYGRRIRAEEVSHLPGVLKRFENFDGIKEEEEEMI